MDAADDGWDAERITGCLTERPGVAGRWDLADVAAVVRRAMFTRRPRKAALRAPIARG